MKDKIKCWQRYEEIGLHIISGSKNKSKKKNSNVQQQTNGCLKSEVLIC